MIYYFTSKDEDNEKVGQLPALFGLLDTSPMISIAATIRLENGLAHTPLSEFPLSRGSNNM